MNGFWQAFAVVMSTMLCGACSDSSVEERPDPPPVQDSAFGAMTGTMDEARAVEDTQMQRKQDLDAALDEQTDGARGD